MLNLVKHTNNSRRITQEGLTFLLVSHPSELLKENLNFFDGFIIDTDSEFFAESIITAIRRLPKMQNSLKPIFVNGIYPLPKRLMIHTDGLIELSLFQTYLQRVIAINKRLSSINEIKSLSNEIRIQYILIAFLYTRKKTLEPDTSRYSKIGYEFPLLSLFYNDNEVMSMLNNLQKMKENSLVSFTLLDYVHSCKSCYSNYLNFRECCPKCQSIDIEAHDMVHHFVCAHVGPEKDFKTDNGLECPKCDKALRHIGIDYDKPSTIHSCNSCSHEFQNPGMLSLCLDCGTENELEELIQKAIGSYQLTNKGEQILFKKEYSDLQTNKLNHNDRGMSMHLFRIILEQEIKRIKISNGDSIVAKLTLSMNQLDVVNEDAKIELRQEIIKIVKSYLLESDTVGTDKVDEYFILLPETREKNLKRLDHIHYNLSKLLSHNVDGVVSPLEITIQKLSGNESVNELLI